MQPGDYDVSLDDSADPADAGGSVILTVGGQSLAGALPSTGGWARYESLHPGTLRIGQPGEMPVTLKPGGMKAAVCNLRAVRLDPVR